MYPGSALNKYQAGVHDSSELAATLTSSLTESGLNEYTTTVDGKEVTKKFGIAPIVNGVGAAYNDMYGHSGYLLLSSFEGRDLLSNMVDIQRNHLMKGGKPIKNWGPIIKKHQMSHVHLPDTY